MKNPIFCLMLICMVSQLNAQQTINNSGNMRIHTGASFTSFGNFSNSSSAVLVNNGDLYIKGDITNDQASMSTGTGTIFLNGTASQSVAGSQSMRTYHLNSNNSAGIVLNNNLSVTGIHSFAGGMIASSATPNYLVYEAGSSHTGSNDSRHVTGWVKKMGNTNFDFPVGDANYLRPVSVTNLSAASEFNCHYYTPSHHLSNVTTPVRMIKANEYWQINKVSGGTGQVTLNWDHSKVPMDNVMIPDIITAYYNGINWTDDGGTATGNVLTTGTITSAVISSFGSFTFGYSTYPVPLTLISFTGERKPGISDLRWITDNEQNVDHFDIQRSYDAVSFTTIGNKPARNTGIQENYYFEDHSPLSGFAWYRLRTVDIDGKASYSRIILLSEMVTPTGAFVVISPVRDAINILNKTGKSGKFNYSLVNAAGQQIIKGNVEMTVNGGAVLPLPVNIAGGIYVLHLNNNMTRFTKRILVQNTP
jgi:hypothetical protein